MQNLNHAYSLTPAERFQLSLFGIPNTQVDAWLGAMNTRRNISGDSAARNYLEHNADYQGDIKHPVLTLHTVIDELVPVAHESAYQETVARAGRQDLLFQAYTNGVGHCNFTRDQLLTAVAAIDNWVKTGERPTQAAFPAAQGFVQNFTPPPFPQP